MTALIQAHMQSETGFAGIILQSSNSADRSVAMGQNLPNPANRATSAFSPLASRIATGHNSALGMNPRRCRLWVRLRPISITRKITLGADFVAKVVLHRCGPLMRFSCKDAARASFPHAKLTGDFANGSEAVRIGDCFPFRNFAKNSSPCNFRLLQQYRH